jgi:hypothetical protein
LNGERYGAIADLVDVAINGDETDAEMRRIGALQLGDVIGDRTGWSELNSSWQAAKNRCSGGSLA